MRGSRRLTFVALLIWACGMLVSAVVPWLVIEGGRSALADLDTIGANAKASAATPRILLIGSSPVVLGLSAEEIARATGLPTYNLGVWTALFFFPEYLDRAMEFVRPDDIVILSNPNWLNRQSPILGEGCIGKFSASCTLWRPRPLPDLVEFVKVLSGLWPTDFGVKRDPVGDLVTVRIRNGAETIPTLPYVGRISDGVVADLAQAAARLRKLGACPLLTLGPIFVEPKERDRWLGEQSAAEARVAELGLSASVITDGMVNTDRSLFLDGFEHPAPSERVIWTRRVVERLVSPTQSPCSRSLAKAEHSLNQS